MIPPIPLDVLAVQARQIGNAADALRLAAQRHADAGTMSARSAEIVSAHCVAVYSLLGLVHSQLQVEHDVAVAIPALSAVAPQFAGKLTKKDMEQAEEAATRA